MKDWRPHPKPAATVKKPKVKFKYTFNDKLVTPPKIWKEVQIEMDQVSPDEQKKLNILVNLLDKVFSIVRRKMAADAKGRCTCVTCGKSFHWSKIECGHYVKRAVYALRWSTINTGPQCKSSECNRHHDGNRKKFAAYIDATYGAGTAAELWLQRNAHFKLEREDLIAQIERWNKRKETLKHVI